jgi:hypothetical protein
MFLWLRSVSTHERHVRSFRILCLTNRIFGLANLASDIAVQRKNSNIFFSFNAGRIEIISFDISLCLIILEIDLKVP